LCQDLGIEVPIICGAMYPCSNPELVAAVSAAGGIGVVQPLSLVYANRLALRDGLRQIRAITDKPIGFNAIVEKSNKRYQDAMRQWVEIALEEGIRFFVTSLGNPQWVVRAAEQVGGVVYHDVTDARFATKAMDAGVRGLICVNNRAGGHAGKLSAEKLYEDLSRCGLPLVAAGGIGDGEGFRLALEQGYAGVQMGTRFIATTECKAHEDYKKAIVDADSSSIVLSEKITGVPVAVIMNDYVRAVGTKAGPLARLMLKHNRMKHWMRSFYMLKSAWKLKRDERRSGGYDVYWQAGKSVDSVTAIVPAGAVVRECASAFRDWRNAQAPRETR
jgi:nitronate monooxygenase